MKIPRPCTVDFETFEIKGRPSYPPKPVGVSIKPWGENPYYFAWGHALDNNCTEAEAIAALRSVWDTPDGLLMHNSKFDLDVAEAHLGLKLPPWDRTHDSMFLMFLSDPHQRTIALKPTAQRLLGMAPEERDAVADWLVEHQPVEGIKISRSPNGQHPPGAYIAYAPGNSIVGPYANGDTLRTEVLFSKLYGEIAERDMLHAYDRERRLMPILLDMERGGIPVDVPKLRADVATYWAVMEQCSAYIYRRLKTHDVNLNSGQQLIEAMDAAGVVDVPALGITEKGAIRSDKKALQTAVSDRKLAAVLIYRSQLKTCLATFMEPWLAVAERSGGMIYTTWNQTRGDTKGTRTGRLSSNPNFQNIPQEFEEVKMPFEAPPLPLCRGYLVARKGEVLCGRDFASQELRVLAHFEDGIMADGYHADPSADFHQLAADMITRTTGVDVTRKRAKTLVFAILYGTGRPALAAQLGITVPETDQLLTAYFKTFPGIKGLQHDLKMRAAKSLPIRTVGGREYFVEPQRDINGRTVNFSYKLLNYLIQGSSADQTKDAMIRFHDAAGPGKLLLTVHDELLLSAPKKEWKRYMETLRVSMNAAEIDVPMLSDGEMGYNWAAMEAV